MGIHKENRSVTYGENGVQWENSPGMAQKKTFTSGASDSSWEGGGVRGGRGGRLWREGEVGGRGGYGGGGG